MRSRSALGTASALALLALTACGNDDSNGSADQEGGIDKSPLSEAYEKCAPTLKASMQDNFAEDAPEVDEVMRLEDEGESLIVSTPEPGGEIASSLAYLAAVCVLEETDAPATVLAQMSSTTAMAGSVDAEWDDIQVAWTYAAGINEGGFNATFAFTG